MIRSRYKAFTLIELLVVVAIIGILAAVGVVAYNGYTKSAKQNAAKSNHKLVVKFVTATMLKSNLNDGYFEGMYENNGCQNTVNKKMTPSSLGGVSNKFMIHLRCLIKTHPFNDPTYPAVNWGPRGILGSVEFQNECISSKPVLQIDTVWNDKNEKLTNQIAMSDYDVTC
ncbi:prepilin-type N-terminal cleavage/methylation domain-containing protein [Candidatus Pelagibacter sp.]|nr:prepilin-type N-terminal cleavage/methylation domain-containing protein [Candidatus Pelagibacter sp.]